MDIYHQFLECFLFIVVEPHEPLTEHHQKKPSFDESLTEQHQGKPSFEESLTEQHQGKPSFEESLTEHQGKSSFEESPTVFLDTDGNLTHNVSGDRH